MLFQNSASQQHRRNKSAENSVKIGNMLLINHATSTRSCVDFRITDHVLMKHATSTRPCIRFDTIGLLKCILDQTV
jgi:hypothetical protein